MITIPSLSLGQRGKNDKFDETRNIKSNELTFKGSTSLFTVKNLHIAVVQEHKPAILPHT